MDIMKTDFRPEFTLISISQVKLENIYDLQEKGLYYKWYEDGMIKWICADREGYLYVAIDRDGKLRWLKSSDIYGWRGGEPIPEQP